MDGRRLRLSLAGAGLVAVSLVGTPAAGAKDFAPGDLRICGAHRCAAVRDRATLRAVSSFLFGEPRPATARRPRLGTPSFRLVIRGGHVAGLVGTLRRVVSSATASTRAASRAAGGTGSRRGPQVLYDG